MRCVSDAIADWLVKQGVEQVFAVTGGGAMFLNQALGGHKGLRVLYMHHEQACAMAAEGYARVSGKPAVVMLTTGPGAINAFNGVFGAFTDSIPMIVISGQVKRETCMIFRGLSSLRQFGDQEGPTIQMASAICKYAVLVHKASDLSTVLPQAFEAAVSGRPGPVWIDIPLDIQSERCDIEILAPSLTDEPLCLSEKRRLELSCREIIARLKTAKRPLILGGSGVRLAGMVTELLAIVEKTGVPMATAWTHDLIASDHRLFAGRPGTIGTRPGNFCLQQADFVLVLGSRLNIRQTSYSWDAFAKHAWIAQVDIDPAELNKQQVKIDCPVNSNLRDFISTLNQIVDTETMPSFVRWVDWCQNINKKFNVLVDHPKSTSESLNPYLVIDQIFKNLRDDDIVVCGNASACIIPFQIGQLKAGQRLFSNSGAASMGYDLPASIGAAAAAFPGEKRRVVCFAGDGSLQMNIQELQTLKTHNFNVIIVVINNAGYLSIRQTHENFFSRSVGADSSSGVELPDYSRISEAYGIPAVKISTLSDLIQIEHIFQSDGPLMVDILVDPKQEFVPRIKSRLDENGAFVTPELDDMYPFLDVSLLANIRDSALKI